VTINFLRRTLLHVVGQIIQGSRSHCPL